MQKSAWLRFLPPVLWEKEPPAPAFGLGTMLRVFEKILTGIDDAEVLAHGDHEHEAIQAVIARLHRLFDPWHTPPEFLDWLASWVALAFPDIWDEYQRRKVTSEMVGIYRQRGLKRGVEDFLDLYTIAEKRPRVTIDDSAKLLIVRPAPERQATVSSLNAQVPLIRPLAIARAPDGSLFLADPGETGLDDEEVWRVFPEGHYQFDGAPPLPLPIGPPPPAFNLEQPIAVAVDDQAPYRVYVLERRPSPAPATEVLFRLSAPGFPTATTVATKGDLGAGFDPVAMAFDPANGHLLILTRPAGMFPTRIFDLDVSVIPPTVVTTDLLQVTTPLSIAVLSTGDLVIGDGRDQSNPVPGDLVLVDRTVGPPWLETAMLAALPAGANPLVAPTAVVEEAPGSLLVADVGLKPLLPNPANPFLKKIARLAGIYRVDTNGPAVVAASEAKQLVWPTGMARAPDGTLFIADRGEAADTILSGPIDRAWRARHQEFGVAVYFPETPATTTTERRRLVHDIRQVVGKEKPAHTYWSFLYRV